MRIPQGSDDNYSDVFTSSDYQTADISDMQTSHIYTKLSSSNQGRNVQERAEIQDRNYLHLYSTTGEDRTSVEDMHEAPPTTVFCLSYNQSSASNTKPDTTQQIGFTIKQDAIQSRTNTSKRKRTRLIVLGVIVGMILAIVVTLTVAVVTRNINTSDQDSFHCLEDWTACSTSCGRGIQIRKTQCSTDTNTKQCTVTACAGGIEDFRLSFDSTTAHLSCYFSIDKRTVSNHFSVETPWNKPGPDQLRNFRGLVGQPCIKHGLILYYEIRYSYKLVTNKFDNELPNQHLILEIGLADRDNVDNHHYIGNIFDNEWVFSIFKCGNRSKICLNANHQHQTYKQIEIGESTLNTRRNATVGIFVDRQQNKTSFYDIEGKNVFYTFSNVLSDADLCPVFAVGYNSLDVQTTITII